MNKGDKAIVIVLIVAFLGVFMVLGFEHFGHSANRETRSYSPPETIVTQIFEPIGRAGDFRFLYYAGRSPLGNDYCCISLVVYSTASFTSNVEVDSTINLYYPILQYRDSEDDSWGTEKWGYFKYKVYSFDSQSITLKLVK